MTPEQFCYWLNGFGELTNERPTAEQWKSIKEHLETVFRKVTPGFAGQERNMSTLGQALPAKPFEAIASPARPPHLVPPQQLPPNGFAVIC
jgi:hypothetical protein